MSRYGNTRDNQSILRRISPKLREVKLRFYPNKTLPQLTLELATQIEREKMSIKPNKIKLLVRSQEEMLYGRRIKKK